MMWHGISKDIPCQCISISTYMVYSLIYLVYHLKSWGVVRTWYVPAHTRYVLCYSIIPPCTAPFEYVLFTPSTYWVRTSQISMYSVRTEYSNHENSTYFRQNIRTFVSHTTDDTSTYRYVFSTYFFADSCTDLSTFLKGTYLLHADFGGVRTFGSWFYCAPGRPAGLLARDSHQWSL